MKKGQWKIAIVAGLLLAGISVIFYVYQLFYTANFQIGREDKVIFIKEKVTFPELLEILKKEQMLHDVVSFAFVSKILNYQQHIKAGRYIIKKNMSNSAAVRMLRAGLQAPIELTFNNVRLLTDFTKRVAEEVAFKKEDLEKLLTDQNFVKKYGFDTTNIMAMFIPNTYQVFWNIKPEAFVEKMHKEYKKFWNEERLQQAKKLDLTPIQVSILASIVQAETQKQDEKPRVAGVYLNRLRKKIKLDADPTLIFAAKDFTIKRVLDVHKKIDSPYNTYKYAGLPPGTINMPTENTLKATLNPEKHDYIFFCAKEDFSGYHNFAVTYTEHLKNARLYQRELDRKGIKK
ncbi:MAG: endolytic transglycosylase MltG [Bacteroidetes bacterium]|nr:MAG: endolytic transglycosylase MltG [Bacteroidota bacterium]TAG90874.1 MAG: endolytic transglycosylase MltG [Bacteroidota bacterium]